ncbi:MAG: hypothetical protein GXO76_13140 [Calditrichaeota bacterium]|nr:hypothetical protein [Calditrichota bacterium]
MKIAVGTDDKQHLRKGHFGDSLYFVIFTVDGQTIVKESVVHNPHSDHAEKKGEHHHHGKAKAIWSTLHGVDVFIGRSMGRESVPKLIERGVLPVLTKIEDIREAVQAFLRDEKEKFLYFDSVEKKFKPYKA